HFEVADRAHARLDHELDVIHAARNIARRGESFNRMRSGCRAWARCSACEVVDSLHRDVSAEACNAGVGWLAGFGRAAVCGRGAPLVALLAAVHRRRRAAADGVAELARVGRQVTATAAAVDPARARIAVALARIERGERAVVAGPVLLAG